MSEEKKPRVLFLCTANSCRSQMAEGWARHLLGGRMEAYSAGVRPARVNRDAVRVMQEVGVDISEHRAKHLDTMRPLTFDLAITLCENVRELCPRPPGAAKLMHWPIEDPVGAVGTPEERLAAFRKARDEIRAMVEQLPRFIEEFPAEIIP